MLLKIAQLQKSAKKYPTKQQINIQRTKKIPPPQKKKPHLDQTNQKLSASKGNLNYTKLYKKYLTLEIHSQLNISVLLTRMNLSRKFNNLELYIFLKMNIYSHV